MPHHKSAVKRLRTAERERKQNASIKSVLRKQIKAYRVAESRDTESLSVLYSALDKAAKRGVIPKQRADRLKARLANIA
jgi:small subunit ribosomal protein S20